MPIMRCLAVIPCLLFGGCDSASEPNQTGPAEPQPTQIYTGYYTSIPVSVSGEELKAALHDLINGNQQITYREVWDALQVTDADPDNPGNVLLIYTGWSLAAEARGNDPSGWNREHLWAKSRGSFTNARGPGTDLHLIRPAEVTVNSARGNKAFDDGGEPYIDRDGATGCRSDADSWEPRAEARGDIARAIFYACVRYEDPDLDLELTEEARTQEDKAPLHGVSSTLIRWHRHDPPDDMERLRNDRVEQIQGNRNPFVDHPEFADRIWRKEGR